MILPSLLFLERLPVKEIIPLLISLASGAACGNIAGALLKNLSLGKVLNSVVGILGGGLGKTILSVVLPMLGMGGAMAAGGDAGAGADVAEAVGGLDLGAILQSVGGGGVGGGALLAIVGMIKKMMASGGTS